MFLKPRKSSTDPRLRSLLQKAVRRGFHEIADRTVSMLDAIGDQTWLRSRTVVIAFEESWPLAANLALDRRIESKRDSLLRVARFSKQKDAAGLGSLSYALAQGDHATCEHALDQRALRIVAEAIARPDDFFGWATDLCKSEPGLQIVRAAEKYLSVATWPWDKAFILAGAYLATQEPISKVEMVSDQQENFPYWVALDKHTDEGKAAMRVVAKEIGVSYRQMIWTSFYLESAQVNRLCPSPWFQAEMEWRLRKADTNPNQATQLWSIARPLVSEKLRASADLLRNSLEQARCPTVLQGRLV